MSIIEQATKRLEQLERAGVAVPWSAARVAQRSGAQPQPAGEQDKPASPVVPIQAPHTPSPAPAARVMRPTRTDVTIDLDGLREFGYLVPDQVRSEMAEQFRHLKRPLLKNARAGDVASGQRGTLIMMTSAMPAEGKTFCSINLAMSMAMEVDTAVILVDADVVRPSVFARMGIHAKPPGLLDLLNRDDLELDDALVATNVPKLLLMASGDPDGRSTELLASASMDRILTKLATDYADHIVIFDAPPVLLTTESTVLASKVGQVVVVVEAAKTGRHTVEMAFAALRHCPIVLSVLNKCDEPSDAKRYGYYYG
jgi:protein-tyrosine kinase